jgi:hypothetical protein
MIDAHNATMEGMREAFVERGPQDLAAALEPLTRALASLGERAAAHEESLSARGLALTEAVGRALPLIDGLGTALQAAARLG